MNAIEIVLVDLKKTGTMLEQYYLQHLSLDKISMTKSHLSSIKWTELRCFNMASTDLNDTYHII